MGAWADIDEQTDALHDKIKGLATEILQDRVNGGFDASEVTAERVESAKGVVRRKLYASNLASGADRFDTLEGLLDALAGSDETGDLIIEAVAYGFCHVHEDINTLEAGGLRDEQSDDFEEDIDETIAALENVAPHALDWTTESGRGGGGAFATTSHRSDWPN